ncbi:DMT family transporter [Vibrio parahaemolyticus]|nr:DMT family transporter [Vibrio parahaemolyticus]
MSENLKGSIFMMLSMAAFAIEDMLVKSAAETVPTGLVLTLFGVGGTILFSALTLAKGDKIFHPSILSYPIFIRAFCEIIGRLAFALAITLTTLSSSSAILQATPLLVAIGGAIFFKEYVSPKHWFTIFIGFIGVILIIRPSIEGFDVLSLFAVIATLGFAGRDLATRAAPKELSNLQLGIYGFLVLIPAGIAMMLYNREQLFLDFDASLKIVGATIVGVAAYYSLTLAMRTGDISFVSPFRYTRLVFALVIGMMIFGENPDFVTILGAVIIAISGGYFLMQNKNNRIMEESDYVSDSHTN